MGSEIIAEKTKDCLTDQQLSLLTESMAQNLEHARHIENERLTFVSFQLMGFGLLLSDIGSIYDKPGLASILISVLLGLNIISTLLLKRWAGVFKKHRGIAETISKLIKTNRCEDLESKFSNRNFLFLFSYSDELKNDKKLKNKKKSGLKLYIKTETLFYWFNALMYALLIGLAIYIWSPTIIGN